MIKEIQKKGVDLKIAIFSTELSAEDYMIRYACMLAGIYKIQLQHEPKTYIPVIQEKLSEITKLKLNKSFNLEILGDILSLEDIQKKVLESKYDLVFIDYVQELTAKGKYDEKDTMPIVGKELKALALKSNCVIVAVSQVNNYAVQKGFDSKSTQVQPFSFGKQLIQASSIAIMLERKKENDKLSDLLEVKITKSRDGELGVLPLKINKGYVLKELTYHEKLDYENGNYKTTN